jgi:hypothetical protein
MQKYCSLKGGWWLEVIGALVFIRKGKNKQKKKTPHQLLFQGSVETEKSNKTKSWFFEI